MPGEVRIRRLKRGDDPRGPAWRRAKVEKVDVEAAAVEQYGAADAKTILALEATLNARFAAVAERDTPALWPAMALRP